MYQKVFDFTASVPLDQIGLNEKALNQESDAVKSCGGSRTFASLGPRLVSNSAKTPGISKSGCVHGLLRGRKMCAHFLQACDDDLEILH